ncbi:Fatty acid desaturase 4, chloroplastic [Porphyridium purpureum]|uniref:Fatty acid desaturase 4, chloroplastic n=1 Tax=Porphyridium purpureum TaxID=35688 RepID=A0A5J4YII5_PORPP|nr:Fatty acid desaturase 4, chloroplastic [Porphyridium purpureum]|eukprot:POR7283..scf289_17
MRGGEEGWGAQWGTGEDKRDGGCVAARGGSGGARGGESRGAREWMARGAGGGARAARAGNGQDGRSGRRQGGKRRARGRKGGGQGSKSRRRAELHTEGDSLEDEPKHVAICAAAALLACINLGTVIGHVAARAAGNSWDLLASCGFVGLAGLVAYAFADFATGVYHWGVDNYGDRNTPVFGYQIDAFQGHHKSPWTITERGVFNNVHKACVPALPLLGLMAVCNSFIAPELMTFLNVFFVSVIMSQEIHKWAHMLHPPALVVALQDARVLLSRKVHGLHHNSPFEGNYCIVNGWCNQFLDRIGFFRKMELFFFKLNGAVPNTWLLEESLRQR